MCNSWYMLHMPSPCNINTALWPMSRARLQPLLLRHNHWVRVSAAPLEEFQRGATCMGCIIRSTQAYLIPAFACSLCCIWNACQSSGTHRCSQTLHVAGCCMLVPYNDVGLAGDIFVQRQLLSSCNTWLLPGYCCDVFVCCCQLRLQY
jgi:hypothetical protein